MTTESILCVDDDPSILVALRSLIEESLGGQCEVEVADNGAEALEVCDELRRDGRELTLVISDFIMPSMRGDELLARLHEKSPRSIKIMLTGQSNLQGVKRAINEANLYRFLEKPYENADLKLTIQSALRAYRQARELELKNRELQRINADLESSQSALRESMHNLRTTRVTTGVYWVQVPEAGLYVLCGAPADVVKHLMLRGYIAQETRGGVSCETGPNAILLADTLIQNGGFSNLCEFPVLQMLYRQGMILPGHPNNVGRKPILIGSRKQVKAQLDYIYRGNYGLASKAELVEAGLDEAEAGRRMALKLGFAFGRILASDELLDARVVESEPVEIAGGVQVRRLAPNRFEFSYRGATSEVDLGLKPEESYESPYSPVHQLVDRQFFGVIHCGEGDGWDLRRQSMSSIVVHQGRYYLVDAGPVVIDTLQRLGIDLSEIEGVFHTHAHDDHFAGLPALILSGHKLKYFATPAVRRSVMKKLSALTGVDESVFGSYFDVRDLAEGEWNDCSGLQVMPLFSPHPVENDVFVFRVKDDDGWKSYAHWADIVSFDVLKKLLASAPAGEVLGPGYLETIRQRYLTPATVKKIDAGGGLIHGLPLDFVGDKSGKIILAHRAGAFSSAELRVGSQASFGSIEVLIRSDQTYLHRRAFRFLSALLPQAGRDLLDTLMRAPIENYNAGSLLIKEGARDGRLFLVLSGTVEYLHPEAPGPIPLATGSVLGARQLFSDEPLAESWRAVSAVRAMSFSVHALRDLLPALGWSPATHERLEDMDFLQRTALFGPRLGAATLARLTVGLRRFAIAAGETLSPAAGPELRVVRRGRLELSGPDGGPRETLGPGDVLDEERLLGLPTRDWRARADGTVELLALDPDAVADCPILLWKLREIAARRRSC